MPTIAALPSNTAGMQPKHTARRGLFATHPESNAIFGTEWTEDSQVPLSLGTESADSPEVSPCDKDEHRGGSMFYWVSSPNRQGPFWAPDAAICRNSCRAIGACEYFSWFPSWYGSPTCWLHPAAGSEKVSGWNEDAGAISGAQSCI